MSLPNNLPSADLPAMPLESAQIRDPAQAFGITLPDTLPKEKQVATRPLAVLREVIETVGLAIAMWLLINLFIQNVQVVSVSMLPTLHEDQRLIVNKSAYWFGEPDRGDVIVFRSPQNGEERLIKRVIGLPGDTLEIRDGIVYINEVIISEPYISAPTNSPRDGRWTIPPNSYFVMGDNRPSSNDSRSWGMVPQDFIIGRAVLSVWPIDDWGVIQHYEYDSLAEAATR
ncbi:MAG: signal peptidase I [Chloroflexi bacterium]|nr:signal peptidase I [Chloroflexota bacterium]